MNADRSTRRRTRSFGVSILLVVGALLALGTSSAMADAGNPIVGTTKADLVQNPNGTVTVYVRGQWNWLSHKSDCNFDRAATGLSMIWNDSTETGYPLNGKTVSAQVGVATKDKSWEDPNPIDGMVHPVDRGNIPEGLPGVTNPPFKVEQEFKDPAPQAAGETHPTATWRGGCGREPLTHVDAYTNFPWGSWGYEKKEKGTDENFHLGYSHVYRSRDFVPKSVCVNFYDVHDSGFQVPNSSNSLDVLANDDNSIEENDFAVNGGSCVHFVKIKTKSTVSANLGEPITDTATITDAVTTKTPATDGTITFTAFKDPTTCTGKADFTSGPTAVDLDKSTEVTSEQFSPTSTGTYYWIATFHSTADPQATDISTTCKEAEESTVVGKAAPELKTKATTTAIVGDNISDVATLSGLVGPDNTGTVTFDIYKGANCLGAKLNANPIAATPATVNANGDYTSANFNTATTGAGEYHWIAHFSGDANNKALDGACLATGENTEVEKATPELKTKATTTAIVGDNISDVATLAKLVSPANTGTVTFDIYKGANCLGAKLNANPIAATPATVNANGDYTSANFNTATTGAGEYHWIAHFSGDANNKALDGACLATGENTEVEKATPELKTKATTTAIVGDNISDVATLAKLVSPDNTGTVTFDIYKGANCLGAKLNANPIAATPATVNANGDYTSANFNTATTGAGEYHWIAHFSGDANNKALDGACLATGENTEVEKATPELKTKATTTAIVGDNISDVATLAKLVSPDNTGTVTFDIYKGANCLGAKLNANPIAATPATVNANGDYTSANFNTATTGAGEYHWIAHFSGDANNKALDGACLATGENTEVEKATPELKTKATTTAIVGDNISDVATLAKLVSPANTGTVTFDIYKGANCLGAKLNANPIAATPATVNANGDYTSANFNTATTGAGEYHWIAHFSGDANNKALDGACLATGENTEVEKATPELKTKATTTAIVGDNISDVATLAKLVSPANTGTVTFDIYKGANCLGAKLNANPIAATPATVNANGDYTSANFNTATTGAGEYHWIAHFSGDANNKALDGACLATGENTEVEKATPELKTKATTTAIVGDNISDVATLAKLVSPANTGTVTFDIYKGANCLGAKLNANPIAATPATVNANGDYTSANFNTATTGAGEYHWIAHFSGDANNKALDGACLATGENTEVEKATPELKTKATTTAIVGDNISDVATLAKLVSPANTGTVTFDIYKGANCLGAKLNANPIAATPATVNANGDYTSANFNTATTGAGEYHWIAHFSGDANNKALDGACLATGENTEVEKATPELKTKATTTAIVGDNISDVATLAKLVSPANTGTVTFDIYKGANCLGAKLNANPIAATPATVNANGDYTSANFNTATTGAGEYHWIAHFSGDANNKALDGACLATGENTEVEKATPELKTKATTTAIVGDNISDVATLAKLVSPDNTGTVTFDIYKGANCLGAKLNANPIAATPATVNANGDYTSANFNTATTGAGEYHWIAHFSGDANNKALDGACLATGENTEVEKATPELKTKATTTAIVGDNISDVATLAKLVSPANTGTVTFDIYKGANCLGAKLNANPIAATPATVNANGDYTSANFNTATTGAGEYHWIAHFSGDANNKALDGACLATGENTEVEKATPELKTKATTTAIVGDNISDVATLAKLVSPDNTGTVTFDIYKGANCLGAKLNANPIAATPATVNANGDYTSANFNTATTGAGEYHWIAHFSGDANNKALDGACLATGENTEVEKATPELKTKATTTAIVGDNISDVATLAKLVSPDNTGTVTFDIYKGANCLGAKLNANPIAATPATVNANGDYTSANFNTATTGAGEYHWIAHFSGDANNKALDGACLATGENTEVEKATPELKTKATTTAIVGDNISDVATLAKLVSPANTGTVTFDIYKGANCLGAKLNANPIAATPATVNANGDYTSANFNTATTGAGEYHWIAHFSGDANNKALDGACLATGENTEVEKATPELKTKATTTAIVGDNISDVATLAKLVSPANTGTVTFDIYKGANCLGAKLNANPIAATPATVNANGDYTSANFNTATTGAGEYHWIAHFSGDANNKALDGACLATGENTTVEKASPQITTDAGPGTLLGGQVTDTAHLSGGHNPTGSITFRLYNNPNCAGTPAAEVTNSSVNGNGDYASPSATPAAAGDYFWVAIYSGDANNKGAQTGCSDPTEKVTITNPPAGEVAASKIPPPECKLRKARARFFIYTRHNRVRLVIRYVAYTKATITTSFVMHGRKGNLNLGKATKTFNKKGVFRLPKHLTPAKMKKIRAATDFGVQFQIPGTPAFCQAYFKRTLTVARFVEGQKVWFQTGSVFGGDV